jgi:hypothetical protein
MKYFKLTYPNGNIKYCMAINSLEVIKEYDLCTRENCNIKLKELQGEQEAIAIDYLQEEDNKRNAKDLKRKMLDPVQQWI